MKRLDRRGRVAFENVADEGAAPSCPISREELLARFHVRLPDGRIVEGSRAFLEAYAEVPGLSWLRPIGRWEPSRRVLDRLYSLFLRVRPRIQALFR